MIYVDDYIVPSSRRRPWKWAGHLFAVPADDTELIDFAAQLGLQARYIQKRGTPNAHFDLSFRKRQEAIAAGAASVGWLEGARIRHGLSLIAAVLDEPNEYGDIITTPEMKKALDIYAANLRLIPRSEFKPIISYPMSDVKWATIRRRKGTT